MSDPYSWCFVCGKDNPVGLKLDFVLTENEYSTIFTPGPEHQGYIGRVHGGIISTVLDEVMAGYVNETTGKDAFTARMELRYRQPVPVGKPLRVVGRLERHKGRMYEMKGELLLDNGTLAVEATSKVLLAAL